MADLFFDDFDEEDEEAATPAKPSPGYYQNLLGDIPKPKGNEKAWRQGGSDEEEEEEESAVPDAAPPRARYWWEEGYEAPEEEPKAKVKENKRVWNRKTRCYEDVGAPASRSPSVSSKASSSSHEGMLPGRNIETCVAANQVEALDEVLERINTDMAADELPENYHARPVPKREWNPDTGTFEAVSETAIVPVRPINRGWIPRKEEASSSSTPLAIEDIIRKLDTEEESSAKPAEVTTLALVEAEGEIKKSFLSLSTKETPAWSGPGGSNVIPEEDMEVLMDRYKHHEDFETPALYGLSLPDHVQQVKKIDEIRRRKRDKAIDEVIAENPEMEEYFRPKRPVECDEDQQQEHPDGQRKPLGKWTQSGPTERRTTVAQDQGEGPVKFRPTKREALPGLGRPKRTSEASAASASSAKPREVPLGNSSASASWSGFSLLPGMPLPFERAVSSSAPPPEDNAVQASSSATSAVSEVVKRASPQQTFSSQILADKSRVLRPRRQEVDDEADLQEAFQSIGGQRGFQPMRGSPKFLPKSKAKLSAKASASRAGPRREDLVGDIDSTDVN